MVKCPASLIPVLSLLCSSMLMAQPRPAETDEIAAGKLLSAQWQKQEGVSSTPQSVAVEKYLQHVGDRLALHAQRKLPYRFLYDPNPNFKSAIGLPGGVVIVGGGILAYTDTEDQLAAVLGHEIEHIALNQCGDRLAEVMAKEHITSHTLYRLRVGEFSGSYGHDRERQADFEGAKLEKAAGYSVNGFIHLLQTFLVLSQPMENTAGEGQTVLQERIDLLKPLLAFGSPEPPETPLHLPPAVP